MKAAENGMCIMKKRSHIRPSYHDHHGDPVQGLLAASVVDSHNNAAQAITFYDLPPESVFEVGIRIEL